MEILARILELFAISILFVLVLIIMGCASSPAEFSTIATGESIAQETRTTDGILSVSSGDVQGLSPLAFMVLLLVQIFLSHRREVKRITARNDGPKPMAPHLMPPPAAQAPPRGVMAPRPPAKKPPGGSIFDNQISPPDVSKAQ